MKESDEIESRLAALRPIDPSLDRDALMYRAGYAAGRTTAMPSRVFRTGQAAALAVAAAATVLLLRVPPEPARPDPAPVASQASIIDQDPLARWLERPAMTRPESLPPEAVIGQSSDRITARTLLDQLLSESITLNPSGDKA